MENREKAAAYQYGVSVTGKLARFSLNNVDRPLASFLFAIFRVKTSSSRQMRKNSSTKQIYEGKDLK